MHRPPRRSRSEAGFSLTEMVITLGILVVVLLGVLALFDLNGRIARTQSHLADMQQSQRVAQQSILKLTRMAGRGGLLSFDAVAGMQLPDGVALEVSNNVASGTKLGGCNCAQVLEGTDVLTVRGVMSSPLYQLDPQNTSQFDYDDSEGGTGTLIVFKNTPTGAPQDLTDLADAVDRIEDSGGTEALLLGSAVGQYAVVEMVAGGTVDRSGSEIESVTVKFLARDGTDTAAYRDISFEGDYPSSLQQVLFAGIVEEYRFYVRDRRSNPADDSSDVLPQLARARFFPNTDKAYRNDDSNLADVVADNILDLQVALGIDQNNDGVIVDGAIDPSVNPESDEWLFNHPSDNVTNLALWNDPNRPLFYVRVTTLARTDRRTPQHQSDLLATIEDKDYTQSPFDRFNLHQERQFHRRQVVTTLDLRNL